MTKPIHLSANQPSERFYLGGPQIKAFRGQASSSDRVPEDWVGSSTTLFGETELGLSFLESGRTVASEIAAAPELWLGPEHLKSFGADPMLLVKLLDAGQRLPVHIHPNQSFAKKHLGCQHGKAEAWYILNGGVVYLGFKETVSEDQLRVWVDSQDVSGMLQAMHQIEVAPGDSIYVPPGCPHAIGAGVFLAEVQEPEDLSILLEWDGFAIDGPNDGHLGLGFDLALRAISSNGMSAEDLNRLVVRQGKESSTLSTDSAQYFRAERIDVSQERSLDAGFSILIVLSGQGELQSASATTSLAAGDTILIPYSAGQLSLSGEVSVLRCRPPMPN